MSRSNDEFDLNKHMNAFSISSNDEKLAQQLDKTHLQPSNSIFTVPSRPHQQPLPQQQQLSQQQPSLHYQQQQQKQQPTAGWNQQQDAATWNKGNADPWETHNDPPWNSSSGDQDEGWGQGPPGYTTISQGTYFGFNSIIESPDIATMSKRDEVTENSRKAFSKYKNKPVTFHSISPQP